MIQPILDFFNHFVDVSFLGVRRQNHAVDFVDDPVRRQNSFDDSRCRGSIGVIPGSRLAFVSRAVTNCCGNLTVHHGVLFVANQFKDRVIIVHDVGF